MPEVKTGFYLLPIIDNYDREIQRKKKEIKDLNKKLKGAIEDALQTEGISKNARLRITTMLNKIKSEEE